MKLTRNLKSDENPVPDSLAILSMDKLIYKDWNEERQKSLIEYNIEMDENDTVQEQIQSHLESLKNLMQSPPDSAARNDEIKYSILRMSEAVRKLESLEPSFVTGSQIVQLLYQWAGNETDNTLRENMLALIFYVLARSTQAVHLFVTLCPAPCVGPLLQSDVPRSRRIGCYLLRQMLTVTEGAKYCLQERLDTLVSDLIGQFLTSLERGERSDFLIEMTNVLLATVKLMIHHYPDEVISDRAGDYLGLVNRTVRDPALRREAVNILVQLCCREKSAAVLQSGAFASVMEMFTGDVAQTEIVLLASQMLAKTPEMKDEIIQKIPLDQMYAVMMSTTNADLRSKMLTLFTNLISLEESCAAKFYNPQFFSVLLGHYHGDQREAQLGVAWFLWNLMRACSVEFIHNVLGMKEIVEILIGELESEDVLLLTSAVIPALVSMNDKFIAQGAMNDPQVREFMNQIEPKMVSLSYTPEEPELQSLAASCLRVVFPAAFEREEFV